MTTAQKTKVESRQLLAEAYLRVGKWQEAKEVWHNFPINLLFVCGEKCISNRRHNDACEVYMEAFKQSPELTRDKLMGLGELLIEMDCDPERAQIALTCFSQLGAREHLVRLGKQLQDSLSEDLESSSSKAVIRIIQACFRCVNMMPELIALGDLLAPHYRLRNTVIEIYKEGSAYEKLLDFGDHLFGNVTENNAPQETVESALMAYEAADAVERQLRCANWFFEQVRLHTDFRILHRGFDIYEKVGAKPPMHILESVLDRLAEGGCTPQMLEDMAEAIANRLNGEEWDPTEDGN